MKKKIGRLAQRPRNARIRLGGPEPVPVKRTSPSKCMSILRPAPPPHGSAPPKAEKAPISTVSGSLLILRRPAQATLADSGFREGRRMLMIVPGRD